MKRSYLPALILALLIAMAIVPAVAEAAVTTTLTDATEVRAVWEWTELNGTYNNIELYAAKGTPVTPGTTGCFALLSWVRDFGDGPAVYANAYADIPASAFKAPGKSLNTARLQTTLPFEWGAVTGSSAVLDVTWNGVDGLVMDDKYSSNFYDPLTGVRTISRERYKGRFANATGSIILPEIGFSDVSNWWAVDYDPPFIMYSGLTSIEVAK